MSAIVPPAAVKGVDPKKPAKNRKQSCAAKFGDNAAAIIQIAKTESVKVYTMLLPKVSENGPENKAPMPNPNR